MTLLAFFAKRQHSKSLQKRRRLRTKGRHDDDVVVVPSGGGDPSRALAALGGVGGSAASTPRAARTAAAPSPAFSARAPWASGLKRTPRLKKPSTTARGAASLTLRDFFKRAPKVVHETPRKTLQTPRRHSTKGRPRPGDLSPATSAKSWQASAALASPAASTARASLGAASPAEAEAPAVCGLSGGDFAEMPAKALRLVWGFCGQRHCSAVRQAGHDARRLCATNHATLKQELDFWALATVDPASLKPVAKAAGTDGAASASRTVGRSGHFTMLSDGAGRCFLRGPALLRCTHRWRLKARAAELLGPGGDGKTVSIPLREAIRRSGQAKLLSQGHGAGELGSPGGRGAPSAQLCQLPGDGEASELTDSVHLAASIWDRAGKRPPKRRRLSGDFLGTAQAFKQADAVSGRFADSDACGQFAVRRWEALMDRRVPWRLRAAALVYHHHCVQGCRHTDIREAAAAFVKARTRHDMQLRSSLLSPVSE